MAQLKDLIVSGVSRFVGKVYASEIIGNLTGTAARAIADRNGNNIDSTYLKDMLYSDGDLILTYGDNNTKSYGFIGDGATSVTSDSSGNVTISSTDTHYNSSTAVAATNDGTSNAAASNGSVYINHIENGVIASTHNISGYGGTVVTSDASGNIVVSSGSVSTFVGYGTCDTATDTAAKIASVIGYGLSAGNIIGIKFTNAVDANATLNISDTGAKSIFYRGIAIVADVIKAGTTALFIYDGTQYQLVAMDYDDIVNELDGGEEVLPTPQS